MNKTKMNLREHLVEDGPLTADGRAILEWVADNRAECELTAVEPTAVEPYRAIRMRAAAALGIDAEGGDPMGCGYLGYAVEAIVHDLRDDD